MHTPWSRILVSLSLVHGLTACGSDGSGASNADASTSPDDSDADTDEGGGNGGGDSGGGSGSANDAPAGPPSDGLGLAALPSYSTADNDAFLAGVAGTHEVVIFRTPQENEGALGKGSLVIARKGDGFTAELRAGDGSIVSSVDSATAKNAQLTPVIGQVFGFANDQVDGYLAIRITAAGEITGTAGGFGQVGFRNNVTAFGRSVPSLFRQLAGTYRGVSQALTCAQPEVVLELAADGKAELSGSYNLSCGEQTLSNTWDGNDDYVVPYEAGYELMLDSIKGGGSQEGGGISIRVNAWSDDAQILLVNSNGAGAAGAIASASLIKDGALPTQAQFVVRMLEDTTVDVVASGSTDLAPWNMANTSFTIGADQKLSFAGQLFDYQLDKPVEGTTDQKTFRFQAIYETYNLLFVELTFKTDKTFVSGVFGGVGEGSLSPK